jgi:putative phosphoribosyl transferase
LSLQSFNIVLSKRLRNPFNFENTIGSIFQDGSVYLIPESKNFSCEYIQMEINRQRKELEKQISLFRVCDEMYNFKNKTIVLIDDGCYTGSTMMVTSKWLRSHKPYKIIAALPVISKYALHLLSGYVDKIEYIIKPRKFRSVEEYYEDFRQIPESKIIQLLDKRKYHFD